MRCTLRHLSFAFLCLALATSVLPWGRVAAQTESLLSAPGIPEIVIQADDDQLIIPGNLRSARTLIRFDNMTDRSLHPLLVRLPKEIGSERALGDLQSGINGPPEWLMTSAFPGFVGETPPGVTSYAMIDLVSGDYVLIANEVLAFEVTGAGSIPPAQQKPPVDIEARVFDYEVSLPARIEPGRQVWSVTNTGTVPHELVLAWTPDAMTGEEMEASLGLDVSGTPPDGLTTPVTIGGIGWLSPGQTAWTELDLPPGSYLVFCLVYDPDIRATHLEREMIESFTIGEGATPGSTPAG